NLFRRHLIRSSRLVRAVSIAALAATFTIPALAQEITIPHAQGETTLAGVPSKVLVQDWATFDNLTALGVAVAGVPSSNAPAYLQPAVAADALKLGSLFEPD